MLCSQTKILDGRTNRLESIFEALFNDRSDVPEIDQNKFLVPADLSVGQFVYVIRKRIKLSTEKAIYIFVKTCFHRRLRACLRCAMSTRMMTGSFYIKFSGENYFGQYVTLHKDYFAVSCRF